MSRLDARPLLIAAVHVPPLPGAPRYAGDMDRVLDRVRRDAELLGAAGFDGVVVENFGDTPFHRGPVPPETVAGLTRAVDAARAELPDGVALGVNVLRNDARAALGIAAVGGLDFVRVNVLTGAAVTDQGVIQGDAAELLRARSRIAPGVKVFADAHVKHARPLAPRPLAEEACDLLERALADAVIVTGQRSGLGVAVHELGEVRRACPKALVLAGSGVTRSTADEILAVADGVIVGTAIEQGGRTGAPVDRHEAAAFVDHARSTFKR